MTLSRRPTDRELLSSVKRHLDRMRVLAENPGMDSADLDEFFRRLEEQLDAKDDPPGRGVRRKVIVRVDGASRGNPGPAAYGVVIEDEAGRILAEAGATIGRATNNEAEYRGLICGLEMARKHCAEEVAVRADSELVVRQIAGEYRVKSPTLRPLHLRAMELLRSFARYEVTHVPREENARADALANAALDAGSG